jgi:hypothetical protein
LNDHLQVEKSGRSTPPRVACTIAPLVLLALACAACGSDGGSAPASDSAGRLSPTPAETAAAPSWIVLFDGSTDALRGYGGDSFPTSWAVDGGELYALPGAGVDLISRASFSDFELEFEWRVPPGGNSGVLYRVVESDAPSWATGPEYQVLDDDGHPDGGDALTSAAALYGLIAPNADRHLEPVGSVNRGRIIVRDGHVEHWLNGRQVVAYTWNGPDVRSRIAASKFRAAVGFMAADAGGVVFQHHGEEVWFRNLRIRPLS